MTDALLALAVLWALLVAVWLAVWPLVAGGRERPDPHAVELRELEAEKDRLVEEIHELDLDLATGKLASAEHAAQEARLKRRAVEVMREIESRREAGAPEGEEGGATRDRPDRG